MESASLFPFISQGLQLRTVVSSQKAPITFVEMSLGLTGNMTGPLSNERTLTSIATHGTYFKASALVPVRIVPSGRPLGGTLVSWRLMHPSGWRIE